jgi:hypothetical protein
LPPANSDGTHVAKGLLPIGYRTFYSRIVDDLEEGQEGIAFWLRCGIICARPPTYRKMFGLSLMARLATAGPLPA